MELTFIFRIMKGKRQCFLPCLVDNWMICSTSWVNKLKFDVLTQPHNESLVHTVVEALDSSFMKLLLENEAPPNSQDKHGFTLLHNAARFGRPETLSLLIDRRAHPDTVDHE